MARPRKVDLEDAKEGVLNAFWSRGFARTSLSNLTEATGLMRGSLYAAFGGKQAMFSVAIERYVDLIRTSITTDAPGIEGIRFTLNTVVRITCEDAERRGCMIINSIPEARSLNPANRRAVNQGLERMRSYIDGKIRQAQMDSEQEPDIDALIALVFAATLSIRVLGRAQEGPQLLQKIADGAIAAVEQAFHPEQKG